jgi:hypothetical protein
MEKVISDQFVHLESLRVYEAARLLSIQEKKDLQLVSVEELNKRFAFVGLLDNNELPIFIQNTEYKDIEI